MFDAMVSPGEIAAAAVARPWRADLALRFRRDTVRTVCQARHAGPLRLQKPLYPEGDAICHAVLIHPPGGIAGGDALALDVDVERDAHALLTTPGATKWYKANGRQASQQVRLAVSGRLEWLPQEAIVFDAADARAAIDIELDDGAAMIGWDMIALGRHAAGERFATGLYAQRIRVSVGGRLLWHERTRVTGGDAVCDSPVGLGSRHVFGCLWAAGAGVAEIDVEELRSPLPACAAAPTRLAPALLVARVVATGTAAARDALLPLWSALRPRLFGVAAQPPRLWAT